MTQTIPDLPVFKEYDGIRVSGIGEDGDMIALGHHDPSATLTAFNAAIRSVDGYEISDKEARWITPTWAVALRDRCGECGDDPECGVCLDVRQAWADGGWYLAHHVDQDRPGAFPIMYWSV